jgi:hypothetical protein
MDEAAYRIMKKRFGAQGSWAVWDPDDPYDLSVIEKHRCCLDTGYVFVGLNVSRDILDSPAWTNFHHRHRGCRERVFSKILGRKPWFGSYMTDILTDCPGASSAAVRKAAAADPALLDRGAASFLKQIALLEKPLKTVFVFGADAAVLFRRHRDLAALPWKQITHFASRNPPFTADVFIGNK